MAIAKLIIEDIDLASGEVSFRTEVEGAPSLDDGHMTAAQVMAAVLTQEINSPAFRRKMWDAVERSIKSAPGVSISNAQMSPNRKAS